MITHLSLFSGIGGLDLAAEWAGITTVGQCEWADYPTKVLEKHWPDVPRWRDIRTLTGESFYERTGLRTVDIISGGFPCQPFSVAGKQRGKEDDRYLWPEMVRVIKELRPTWVIGENVAGIVKMALPDILFELEACGYRTRTFLIPACAVGARHRRYRVAIVGYSKHNGLYAAEIAGSTKKTGRRQQEGQKASCESAGASESGNGRNVANPESQHEGRLSFGKEQEKPGLIGSDKDVADTESEGERGLPVQSWRSRQESANAQRSSKNVQHSNCPRREEQYSSGKPDQQGFPCWRCTKGTVCDTTGARLPNRPSQQMGGSEPESEPERPGRNVFNANRSTALRRGTRKGASGQSAGSREYIGNGKEEYAEWQWRTAQSGLGGVVNGISDRMDGDLDFIINHYWDTEPDIPRVASGIPDRVGRLKALGNAVVPQQFYPIFQDIADITNKKEPK